MMEEVDHSSHHEMNVFDCIRTRRSVRKYKDREVPWHFVVDVLQSGKYAPVAGNILNLKFIVVKNQSKRAAIAEASVQQYWMESAPIHIIVIAEPEKSERYYGTRGTRLYTVQSAGAAVQNMLLTSHSLGLGSCWVGAFDEEEIRRLCNLPEQVNVQGIITLGYPDETPAPPPKYRIEHIMYFEKWFGRIEGPKTGIGMWSPYIKSAVTRTHAHVKKHTRKFVDKVKERMKKK